MIDFYWYDGQLRNYLLQFCNIFSGMKVKTGKGENGTEEMMTVPVVIGSRDRVVAAINAGNTQNRPFSLPAMAATISSLALSPNRKGIGVVDKRTFLPAGGAYPNDLKVVTRVMPIQYMMTVDLTLCASNTQQSHQMLEQILMLFDPDLQIQTSDASFDWTKLTKVELIGISNEENYPAGTDRRIINWTLSFEIPIYISAPADIRDDIVKKIFITIGDLSGFSVDEIGDDGNLSPFQIEYGKVNIDGTTP